MTRCKKLYKIDIQDGIIELAKGENEFWYYRSYGYNGYGVSWSRWVNLGDIKSIKRHYYTYENLNGNVINKKTIELCFKPGIITERYFVEIKNRINNIDNHLHLRLPS